MPYGDGADSLQPPNGPLGMCTRLDGYESGPNTIRGGTPPGLSTAGVRSSHSEDQSSRGSMVGMPNVGTNGQLLSDPRLNDRLCCMGRQCSAPWGRMRFAGLRRVRLRLMVVPLGCPSFGARMVNSFDGSSPIGSSPSHSVDHPAPGRGDPGYAFGYPGSRASDRLVGWAPPAPPLGL